MDVVSPNIRKQTDTTTVISKPKASSRKREMIEYPGMKASRMFAGSCVMLPVVLTPEGEIVGSD